MGGHCSQKLLLRRGSHSSPGRYECPAQRETKTLSQRRNPAPTRGGLQFQPASALWKTAGEAEAGSGGDQPAKE